MARIAPVTVVVPTIGRVSQLECCLESLSQCDPMPAEILIVDQSDNGETAAMVGRFAGVGARAIRCQGRGLSLARNFGMRRARHATVLVTDDDCRVERSWVGAAHDLMSENPEGIVTGRVLPLGNPKRVPSTKVDPAPRDYTGELHVGVLFPNNMAVNRVGVLDIGGFDELFRGDAAAEDCDFCYRWLRAGGSLRYAPSMVVWHADWRDDAQLDRLYTRYWYGIAFLYAKHLRRRDFAIIRFVVRSLYVAVHGTGSWVIRREPKRSANPRAFLRGFPSGFRNGWRTYGRGP